MTSVTDLRAKAEHLHEIAEKKVCPDQANLVHELAQRMEQQADAEEVTQKAESGGG